MAFELSKLAQPADPEQVKKINDALQALAPVSVLPEPVPKDQTLDEIIARLPPTLGLSPEWKAFIEQTVREEVARQLAAQPTSPAE
jgi:hypothetical protein